VQKEGASPGVLLFVVVLVLCVVVFDKNKGRHKKSSERRGRFFPSV
jgi:hypothetical protein